MSDTAKPDTAKPTPTLDVWTAIARRRSLARTLSLLVVPFSVVCIYVLGRLVFGFESPGGWAVLAALPILIGAYAARQHHGASRLAVHLENRIGTTGIEVLRMRDEVRELTAEIAHLLELKKSFLQSLRLHAAEPGVPLSSDLQVRVRGLEHAIEQTEPAVEKVTSQMDRLEAVLAADAGGTDRAAERWEELHQTYEHAVEELREVHLRLVQ